MRLPWEPPKVERAKIETLLGHGPRRLVTIGVRANEHTSRERLAGYRAGMNRTSLAPRSGMVEHPDLLTAGRLGKILREHGGEGIFALNRVSTLHVLRGSREPGIKTGPEMPLISFDDFDRGDLLAPRLSVMQQPPEMLGRESARLRFEWMKGPGAGKQPRAAVLPARLVIRESCGCRG